MAMPELSDIAIELACIGIDVLICGVFYKSISAYKNTVKEIKVSKKRGNIPGDC